MRQRCLSYAASAALAQALRSPSCDPASSSRQLHRAGLVLRASPPPSSCSRLAALTSSSSSLRGGCCGPPRPLFSSPLGSSRRPGSAMATEAGRRAPGGDQEDEAGAAAIRARKQAMRREIRSQLGGLSESDLAGESARVWERLAELPQYAEARSVGVFLSMPSSEIRTDALVADASRRGKRLYVPAVGRNFESPDMEMLEVAAAAIPRGDGGGGADDEDSDGPAGAPFYAHWPRNKWHIPEPPPSTRAGMRAAEPGDIDLLVVPGLAFDRRGGRLGQGKGYYDRFLHRMAAAPAPGAAVAVVAVGLRCQLVEEVPTQPDDHPVDIVVLPDEVIHVKKGAGRE